MIKSKITLWLTSILCVFVTLWFVPSGRVLIMGALYEVNPSWFITDATITDGSWEVFSIGDSKTSVLAKLKDAYKEQAYIDERYYREGKIGLLMLLHEIDDKAIFNNLDEWKVYMSKKSSDYVIFKFENEKLYLINRYRKTLELP